MVTGSKAEGGTHILSAGVREILKSIKEVIGNHNHSDSDIYETLQETNMDPNETAQKLLNEDPFHEVKRKRDRKKETHENKTSTAPALPKKTSTAPENRSYSEHDAHEMRPNTHINRIVRRGSYNRTAFPAFPVAGPTREFRVVRDNRVNQNVNKVVKPVETSTSAEPVVSNSSVQSSSKGTSDVTLSTASRSSKAPNGSQHTHSNNASLSGTSSQGLSGGRQELICGTVKPSGSLRHSITSSSNSVIGVYSSSSDPVHVPSLDSRPTAKVGAIRREVGVVGPRRQSSETFAKSSQSRSFSNSHMEQTRQDGGNSKGSLRPLSSNSRSEHSAVSVSPRSSLPLSRSFSGNQHTSKQHQPVGHQKAVQWKPKEKQKSSVNEPGIIGNSSEAVSLTSKPDDFEKEGSQLQDKMSRLNISNNVIIAAHIRVSESDRCQLSFGSFGAEYKSATDLGEESQTEASRLSVLVSESSSEPVGRKQLDLADDHVQNPGSSSPGSGVILDQKLADNRESSSPEDLGNYSDVGLVQDNTASYTSPELQQQQANLPSFSAYDPQSGYDIPYFRPTVDEALRGQGAQEALSSHAANSIPASTIPMVQQVQQHQPIAQMYPQVHVSHFANLMPYRHVYPPVYVPPMAMPGYTSNPAYPHPNGSNYLLMPGGGSHLSANGLKYGIQQFKPVPTGSGSGFGNFTSPTGYAINTPGVIGSAAGLEDSSRIKYKDGNLYVPNPQAETSEMWMSPRDLSSLQSGGSYYNMSGQTPHGTYLPSHSGHASFNAAAAQSSHMQFPGGLYHAPQATAMANPHHLGSAMAGNVAAPGAQMGAYQQPQLGHLNWTGNF